MSNRAKIKNIEFVGLFARTTLFLESQMPLGKYKGALVEDIIETDPDYMDWFTTAVEQYTLDQAAQYELDNMPRNNTSDPDDCGGYEGYELESPGDLLFAAFTGGKR